MENKFTKGEWLLEDDNYGCKNIVADGQEFFTVDRQIGYTHGLNNEEEDLANAHLIAAAPKMYQALKEALNYIEANAENQEIVMQMHTALAAAEGRDGK